MSTFIDIHVLQTVPPSNLNRDDAGSPKTCVFGGVPRARVSSQAWKRATRRDFEHYLDSTDLGMRTKLWFDLLAGRIEALGVDAGEAATRAATTLKKLGLSPATKRAKKDEEGGSPKTEYLVFLSNLQLDALARLAAQSADPKANEVKAAADTAHSIDIALFGRMVANSADLNVDAAVQVAHAISTHAVTNEFDFYTAVDDQAPEEATGAGMMGTIEFNSSTLYRYATIDLHRLAGNLGDPEATARGAQAFVRSFIQSMPTGKQNTFGNGTLPDAVVVEIRNRPVNLSGAFEDAVPNDGGHVRRSAEALTAYALELQASFAGKPAQAWVTHVDEKTNSVEQLGELLPFEDLVTAVGDWIRAEDNK